MPRVCEPICTHTPLLRQERSRDWQLARHPATVPPCCAPDATFCGVQAALHRLARPLQVSARAGVAATSEAAVSANANAEETNVDLDMRNMVAPATVMSAGGGYHKALECSSV